MEIRLATSDTDLSAAAELLLQLRPQFSHAALLRQIRAQQEDGYQVAIALVDGIPVAVAGFVINRKLAWGKHIYVDDLVTDQNHRSSGAGKALVSWLKHYGRENNCEQLHLDSGVQRFAAHRFYLREGFDITSHHFATTL
ncbi:MULTISPECIES: GNAT family N-acetyltransferase [Microbulbifer]|uniref:GNAT family N-acetyltransferase n=1 Tax=Microbulbifer TaxID=48073 RepID=UPI001E3076E5|nr:MULTISPECIES: GNAT family N-acetyltransferase [Microbulbifer]UHQ57029.1 GNAT family N-acetyltransferase [Microbulbifer sp. YPW16]